jgi:antirestriction protein ArdC
MTELRDCYTRITSKIVESLEAGVRPWHRPWSGGNLEGRITLPLRHNGIPYRGINVIMLWLAAEAKGYTTPTWLTFKQASEELGGNVRKGEKGELVVYANTFKKTETTETGESLEREIPFLKGYTVFNVEQCDGLPAQYCAKPEPSKLTALERIDRSEQFIANTKADIRHGGNRAFYAISNDHIQMPPFETFEDQTAYYATAIHELTHWTRHETRLNRDLGRVRWGDEGYAREELVAELGAAFLCADLELTPVVREEHASYIASWIDGLKQDKRAIFSAAAHAQRAADFLHGLQPTAPRLSEPHSPELNTPPPP